MRLMMLMVWALAAAPAVAPTQVTLEEKFKINAQYRNGINKAFKDLGRGAVQYRQGPDGAFGLSMAGSMKNPESGDVYKMRASGEFKLVGKSITQVSQKIELNSAARQYEDLLKNNLPFVWLARFKSLPAGEEAEDAMYRYEGREYRLRYVRLDRTVEATLFQHDLQIGKFFLEGRAGQAPQTLVKARMIGPDHLVLSLVIDA